MSDLFAPQPRPPDYRRTPPGYLPAELDQLFSPPEPAPPPVEEVPQQPSTVPRQRSAPPRQPPVITPLHAAVDQPAARRRPKRRKAWWIATAVLLAALLVAAGALVAMNKFHLGPMSSSSASPSNEAPAADARSARS